MEENVVLWRLVTKAFLLFVVFSFLFVPLVEDHVGKLSLYNLVLPGRERFPYGENPDLSYNLSLFSLDAMYASHVVSGQEQSPGEFRVFVIGDSSVWGTLLEPQETLAGQLNQLDLHTPQGNPIRAYNLGYPTLSLTKDLLFLERAMQYQPDLIIWVVTLESFPQDKQLTSPIVAHNPEEIREMIRKYDIDLNPNGGGFVEETFWDQTLIGQRRDLADIYRLQLYGVMWGITGIDQHYPQDYERASRDLEADSTFHDWQKGEMDADDLAYDLLSSGQDIAGKTPVLFVNEPILVSRGENSDVRYNHYYPLWAYDQYRQSMKELTSKNDWDYLDLWDLVPESEFTNTAIHLTPRGVNEMAQMVSRKVLDRLQNPAASE